MKTNTRIITAEITFVENGEEGYPISEDERRDIAKYIKHRLSADSVVVTNAQDFTSEKATAPREFVEQTMNRFEKVEQVRV